MRLTCPACHAEQSLDAALGREADARAVAALVERSVPLGAALVRYIGLFRPAKRRLGMDRMVALVMELLPDIERGAIARKGRDWPVTAALWMAAFDQVLAARDKGTLTLPLSSHGYLYEVLCGLADKAEAAAERQQEDQRRQRREAGPVQSEAMPLTQAVGAVLPMAAPAPAPAAAPASPEAIRAAREAAARMRVNSAERALARPAVDSTASPTEEP